MQLQDKSTDRCENFFDWQCDRRDNVEIFATEMIVKSPIVNVSTFSDLQNPSEREQKYGT